MAGIRNVKWQSSSRQTKRILKETGFEKMYKNTISKWERGTGEDITHRFIYGLYWNTLNTAINTTNEGINGKESG